MSDLITESLPQQRPLERHQQIETDLFCEHCSYNLHGQIVTRDERLGLMVCRCPECGRFHPAGHKTTAPVLWLSRLAAIALLIWVVLVLAAIVWGTIGFGALQGIYVDVSTYRKTMATDGSTLVNTRLPNGSYAQVYSGTTQPYLGITRYVYTLESPPGQGYYSRDRWQNKAMVALLSSLIAVPAGVLLVVVMWYWKRSSYRWMLLFPYLAAAFVIGMLQLDDMYEFVRRWAIEWTLIWSTFQVLMMWVGTLIGRPVARGLIRLFVPPRPRQYLAFLWQVDGKTLPLAPAPGGR